LAGRQVRKTANEYYLVAAGLPDPNLLPNCHDRAAAIAGFGFAMATPPPPALARRLSVDRARAAGGRPAPPGPPAPPLPRRST